MVDAVAQGAAVELDEVASVAELDEEEAGSDTEQESVVGSSAMETCRDVVVVLDAVAPGIGALDLDVADLSA